MKITAVRLRRLRGTMPTEGSFWEERLVRPIDIYPEYRVRDDFEGLPQTAPDAMPVEAGHAGQLSIPAALLEPGAGETWLHVRAELAHDTPWAPAGHVVSRAQHDLTPPTPHTTVEARPAASLRPATRSGSVRLGPAELDLATGVGEQLRLDGALGVERVVDRCAGGAEVADPVDRVLRVVHGLVELHRRGRRDRAARLVGPRAGGGRLLVQTFLPRHEVVQAALHACGVACPGDSDLQAQAFPETDEIRRGDLLFWPGHVAMATDDRTMVHATAWAMSVVTEDIAAAIARIDAAGDGPFRGARRPSAASAAVAGGAGAAGAAGPRAFAFP